MNHLAQEEDLEESDEKDYEQGATAAVKHIDQELTNYDNVHVLATGPCYRL